MRLLDGIDSDPPQIIVLGGLVPPVLASAVEGAPPHLGTADVDILLITNVDATENLDAVEASLTRMEFTPTDDDGWRWRGLVDGHPVRIEFLCDLDGHAEGNYVRPPGCRVLAASNLRGTGYGTRTTVSTRFAGLGGYLLSKLVAVRTRAATKDYSDFIYVLVNSDEGGPAGAAATLRDGALAEALRGLQSTIIEVRERFSHAMDYGPQQYAEQAEQANPGSDLAMLRADAVTAAQEFFDALLARYQH